MRNSQKRLFADLKLIDNDHFIDSCKYSNKMHFTRKRKMPLKNLLLSIPFRKGKTLYFELKYFKEIFSMNNTISKAGYLKQRQKLNPIAFLELMRFHSKNFYKDKDSVKKWNKYIILAVDGSSCNVPLTETNVSTYGNTSKKGGKERPQIGISCLYDVINRMIIDMKTTMCKFDERCEALCHVDRASEVIGNLPRIYIFDRGYPSGTFLIDMMNRGERFIIRLPSTVFKKEQKSMKSNDECIDIVFDKTRIKAQMNIGKQGNAEKLEKTGSINLRFVKIKLSSESDEYLITNLPTKEISTEQLSQLYKMRWKIESAFDDMKNKLELENFTGSTPIIMEQDIYATGYLYNIMNDIIQDAEKERNDTDDKYTYKMQINRNVAVGVVKGDVIRLLLEKNAAKRKEIMENIIQEINKNILPVRTGRKFCRTKGQLASKYSNVRKRSY